MPNVNPIYEKVKALIISVVVILFAFALVLKTPLAKYPVSLYLSHVLKSDISIQKCGFSFTKGIKAENVEIKNEKGLDCVIKNASIKFNIFSLAKRGLIFDCFLESVKFSYSASEIINAIARLFTIEPAKLLEFDTIDGTIYIKYNEVIIKNLNAAGKDVSLFANGTTRNKKYIEYSLRLILSENFTSKIPEGIRKIFFKKEQEYSAVELSLSGSIKKPSINFSAPLFKLLIK